MIYNIIDIEEDELNIIYATIYDTTFLHRRELSSLTNLFKEIQSLDDKLIKYTDEIKCFLSMCSLSYMEKKRGFLLPFHTKYYAASHKTVKYNLDSRRMKYLIEVLEQNNYIDFYKGYWISTINSKRNIVIVKDKVLHNLETKSHISQGLRDTDEELSTIEIVDTDKSTKTKVYDFNSNKTITIEELVFKSNKGINGVKEIKYDLLNKWKEESTINERLEKAIQIRRNGIVASEEYIPVDERLNALEDVRLVVYKSKAGTYNIQSVNVGETKDFSVRCPVPSKWLGLRDNELIRASGGLPLTFCHVGGFLTVTSTDELDEALRVASIIINTPYHTSGME